MKPLPKNASAREVARLGIISEHAARQMIARGEMPGFYVGNHFRIDVQALHNMLYGATPPQNSTPITPSEQEVLPMNNALRLSIEDRAQLISSDIPCTVCTLIMGHKPCAPNNTEYFCTWLWEEFLKTLDIARLKKLSQHVQNAPWE